MADRPRIASPEHAATYPLRLAVIRDLNAEGWPEWTVYLGTQDISTHPTHAEAITAADKLARQHSRDTGFPLAG